MSSSVMTRLNSSDERNMSLNQSISPVLQGAAIQMRFLNGAAVADQPESAQNQYSPQIIVMKGESHTDSSTAAASNRSL